MTTSNVAQRGQETQPSLFPKTQWCGLSLSSRQPEKWAIPPISEGPTGGRAMSHFCVFPSTQTTPGGSWGF